ncbi:DUF4436 family protein [Streptomyces sp. NPDC020817]|uniref:DUF4436 family protein n=1 Tax=Streptomyces sp. NPDC020817 TaxID=3365095 RepID=UPI00379C56E7
MVKAWWRGLGGRARLWAAVAAALLVVVVACGVGLAAFASDFESQPGTVVTGAAEAMDRVTTEASVQRVNPGQDDLELRVWVEPHGALASSRGETPAREIEVMTPGLTGRSLVFPAGQRTGAHDLGVELASGEFADYPFDRYTADLSFSATAGGRPMPAELRLDEADPLFTLHATESDGPEPGFDIVLNRSRGTFAMVGLMFVVMWVLALTVAVGALVIGGTRRGLVWPAMGWMAATLFALAAFRNTAPGAPPIGCLLDYTAFLWAEAIVAFAVGYVVLRGTPGELRPSTEAS